MTCIERVRAICKERGIPIYKLERDLGFGNGYVGRLMKGVFPAHRLYAIAEYLGVTPEYLMHGDPDGKPLLYGEREVSKDDIKFALFGGDGEITDAMYDEVLAFAAFVKKREAEKKE